MPQVYLIFHIPTGLGTLSLKGENPKGAIFQAATWVAVPSYFEEFSWPPDRKIVCAILGMFRNLTHLCVASSKRR